ncbi:hypothetical protein AB1Y20_005758 [Prymnesium parvum]|uniref:Protein HGH1 homolog n=1 Tax=Prymnesium parvum TaxID=97485 RepID=A0AB34J241_PRYPA
MSGAASATPHAPDGLTHAALLSKLCSPSSSSSDRLIAAHRLNEAFASCASLRDAEQLARQLCTDALCHALVRLAADADELSELSLHLMINLTAHAHAHARLAAAGVLPVLVACVRLAEPHVQLPGLALLSLLAEEPPLIPALLRAGVCKLIANLCTRLDARDVHWLLEIAEAVLEAPQTLRPEHSQQLLQALQPMAQEGARERLGDRDARRLSRVLGLLAVTTTAVPKHLVQSAKSSHSMPVPAAPLAWS